MEYWYCVKHHRVESDTICPAIDRLGPYASEEAAARALETTAERNEEWDKDPRWNDDVEEE